MESYRKQSLSDIIVTDAQTNGILLSDTDNASLNNIAINSPGRDGFVFNFTVDSPTGSANTVTNQPGAVCTTVPTQGIVSIGIVTNSTLLVNGQPCP